MLRTVVSLVDRERVLHAEVSNALSDIALAASSAEPTTIDEWRCAMTRFVEESVVGQLLADCRPGVGTRQTDGGQVIVDLSAKLLVINTAIAQFPRVGNVQCCDSSELLDTWLPYRVPDDWQMEFDCFQWPAIAESRRGEILANPPRDDRSILYGQLATWLVEQWTAHGSEHDDPIQQFQQQWLLTPHPGLAGRSPREVLLARRRYIDSDIQDQGENWTISGRVPPSLPTKSQAFVFGGFGSHEIILYHELTSRLLIECERRLTGKAADIDIPAEVRHLEQLQQEWLHQPHPSLYDQSPAAIIARERSRLPAVVPKGHAPEHDDCPLCRMMFDSDQPMIWQLDNYALADCYATSFAESYAQWEDEQIQWDDLDDDDDVDPSVNEHSCHDEPSLAQTMAASSVWERSHTNMHFFSDMPPLEACAVMMFSIGGHMAELIFDLEEEEDALRQQLHQNFDSLRQVFKEQADLWMLRSTAEEFIEVLSEVSRLHDRLGPKCDDLEEKIRFFCNRYEEHLNPYFTAE